MPAPRSARASSGLAGKPSSTHPFALHSADSSFSTSIDTLSSSGTSFPSSSSAFALAPASEPPFAASRHTAFGTTWTRPSFDEMSSHCDCVSAPGGPKTKTRGRGGCFKGRSCAQSDRWAS